MRKIQRTVGVCFANHWIWVVEEIAKYSNIPAGEFDTATTAI